MVFCSPSREPVMIVAVPLLTPGATMWKFGPCMVRVKWLCGLISLKTGF
jgi:hypothetical protein